MSRPGVDLAEFVAARLDEAAATAVWLARHPLTRGAYVAVDDQLGTVRVADYSAAQVLGDIAVKRRIVDRYVADSWHRTDVDPEYDTGWHDALSFAVSCLAKAWATHPDYDPGWLARWPA